MSGVSEFQESRDFVLAFGIVSRCFMTNRKFQNIEEIEFYTFLTRKYLLEKAHLMSSGIVLLQVRHD